MPCFFDTWIATGKPFGAFGGGEDVYGLFREDRIGGVMIYFHNVQLIGSAQTTCNEGREVPSLEDKITNLSTLRSSNRESKQLGGRRGTIMFELGE